MPDVAVCVPSYGGWKTAMGMSLVSMCCHATAKGVDLGVFAVEHHPVANARNQLVRMALKAGARWLLFADADMTFPADTLERLLAHRRDMVGVLCRTRTPPFPVVGAQHSSGEQVGHLARCSWVGGGVFMVTAEIFRKLSAPWFVHTWEPSGDENNPDGELGEDVNFCRSLDRAGVLIWADLALSREIGHIGQNVTYL